MNSAIYSKGVGYKTMSETAMVFKPRSLGSSWITFCHLRDNGYNVIWTGLQGVSRANMSKETAIMDAMNRLPYLTRHFSDVKTILTILCDEVIKAEKERCLQIAVYEKENASGLSGLKAARNIVSGIIGTNCD